MMQVVTLRCRRIHFLMLAGRAVAAFGGMTPHGAVTVDRLVTVVDEQEGLSEDHRTLYIGALGVASITEHLASIPTYARSPKRMFGRLMTLIAGSPFGTEMVRAAIRVAIGHPGVGGDTSWYIAHAQRQLQSWTHDGVTVNVIR